MNLREFVKNHMVGKSEKTIQAYVYWLTRFQKWLGGTGGDLSQLTRADVQQYLDYLAAKKLSPSTIAVPLSAITQYARWTGQEHAVSHLRWGRPPKVTKFSPKSLTRNERNRLLREVERDGNLRNIAIVYLLLHCGLRVSELCELDRNDVVIGERSGQLTVRRGKRNKPRVLPLPAEARYHLRRYLETRTDANPALFLSNMGRRITTRRVEQILRRYGTHPHALRHTLGRTLIASGMDLVVVAEILGHTDINTTRRYAMPTREELAEGMERAFLDDKSS